MHIITYQNFKITTTINQPHATITQTGTEPVGLDHNPIIADATAKVAMTPTEVIQGHITGTTDDMTGVVHDAHTQVLIHIILIVTFHTTGHFHI